jgi:YVTN family beta-propeller protein
VTEAPALRAGLALLLAAAVVPAAAAGAGGEPAFRQLLDREGIEVEVTLDPLAATGRALTEGDSVRVRVRVTDSHTGEPLSSLYPAAWLDRLPAATAAAAGEAAAEGADDSCRTRVATFVGGSLMSRAELDLNVYYVLALNDGPTISVVDPLFGFGGSKLLAMVRLTSPGGDWALTADEQRLFVTLPAEDRVAVVETPSWQVVTHAPTGPRPERIVLQPDGAYLWVGFDGGPGEPRRSGVTVISTIALKEAAEIATGAGPHDIAFSDDSRLAFVTNRGAGTVSVVDVAALEVVATLPTGPAPASVAWSALGRAAYVTDERAGTVTVIDGAGRAVAARLEAEPGLGRIRFAPGGRWGFVPVPSGNSVYVIDAAGPRVVQNAQVEPGPVEIAFSDELAYVSHRGSDTVLMIPLATVGGEGEPVHVVDFPGGTHAPGDNPAPTPAAAIVPAPGMPAVLVANPRDRAIYFYKEGMAAPMGQFQNYGQMPRAVLVVDRSLREAEPGVYQTTVRLRRPGAYELALFLDSPRVVHCFPLVIAADPDLAAQRAERGVVARALAQPGPVPAGEEVTIAYRLTDPAGGAPRSGLTDVRALALSAAANWHRRLPAEESASEPGVYRVRFTPARPGVYYVFIEVPSLGVEGHDNRHLIVQAVDAAEAVAASGAGETGEGSP